MSQYFIESKQPMFFSFNQIIQSNETDLEFKLLRKYHENFEKEQEDSWLKFWCKQGEEHVLQTWNEKYSSYLKDEYEKVVCNKQKGSEISKTQTQETCEVKTILHEKSWEDLWREHRNEIYCQLYFIFTTVYYKYFIDLKTSCETAEFITEVPEEIEEEKNIEDLENDSLKLQEELEQLTILGLPTSFGGRPQNSGKNPKICRKSTTHYSNFFSDSEMENEVDDSDLEDPEKASTVDIRENDDILHNVQQTTSIKIQKRKRNRKLKNIPTFILEDKDLLKYWRKRYSLFSRFDEGIRLDRESWFSVTPEKVAKHLAERLKCNVLVDGFCGSGGNVIQFALICDKVIAIDIDPIKIEMAKHNAEIYKVSHKIEFILGDFLQLAAGGKLKADIVFLSPPWGGPKYKNKKEFDIEKHLLPVRASVLVEASRNVSQNIALFLPRRSCIKQIIKLAGIGNRCEIEHNYLDSRLVALTALYGEEILTKEERN